MQTLQNNIMLDERENSRKPKSMLICIGVLLMFLNLSKMQLFAVFH